MFNTVLLTIDLNEPTSWQKALPAAVAQCRLGGAKLHLLNVVPDFGLPAVRAHFPAGFDEQMRKDALAQLEALADQHVPDDVDATCHIRQGAVYEEVLAAARDLGADLIVMQSHRPELKDYLLGPNAARVVRHAEISVLVLR